MGHGVMGVSRKFSVFDLRKKGLLLFSASMFYSMAIGVFLFFHTPFANLHFVFHSLLMTICDMPSVFLDFQALYLQAYWLECSTFSFLKICTARWQLTMSQIFEIRKISAKKLSARIKWKNPENFLVKLSNFTYISIICVRRVPMLLKLVQNQPFSMPY